MKLFKLLKRCTGGTSFNHSPLASLAVTFNHNLSMPKGEIVVEAAPLLSLEVLQAIFSYLDLRAGLSTCALVCSS
jgi:hypothetical protein